MDVNEFLCKAMIDYTSNRKLAEVGSDIMEYLNNWQVNQLMQKTSDYPLFKDRGRFFYMETGSSSEGLGFLGNDTDTMIILPDIFVTFGISDRVNYLTLDSKFCNKGFCYISVSQANFEFFELDKSSSVLINGKFYLKRDAFLSIIQPNIMHIEHSVGMAGPSFIMPSGDDYVPAVKCVGWYEDCDQFFKRKRYWPPQELLDEIYKKGMHIVFTSFRDCENSDNPLEYRFSFSQAEKCLIRNLPTFQFASYYLLKIIKDEFAACKQGKDSYAFKSYFVKVILLYYCEMTEPQNWSKSNFLGNVKNCLQKILHCFQIKFLPHYFIESCNLLLKCSNEECDEVIKDLTFLLSNWNECINKIFFFKNDFYKMLASSKTRKMTRKYSKIILEQCKEIYQCDYFIDHLSLCLEADYICHITYRTPQVWSERGMMEAALKAIENLKKIVPNKYFHFARIMLFRMLAYIFLLCSKTCGSWELPLNILRTYNSTIIYPESRFLDRISSKVWVAFYSFLFGNDEETVNQISSIDNLDNLSPVGYMSLLFSNFERDFLYSVDRVLHNIMGDYLLRHGDDKLEVNCVVLAHYLRAQVCNKLKGFESIKKYINTVNDVEKALRKVFKWEDRVFFMIDMLSHTKRLLEKVSNKDL